MQLPNAPYQTNRLRRQPLTGTVSLGDTLGAVTDDALTTNPFSSLQDVGALERARQGEEIGTRQTGPGRRETIRAAPSSPYVPVDEQQRRLKELGLDGKLELYDGETEDGFSMRVGWKQDEIKSQAIMANSDDSALTSVLSFGVGLGASVLDPINIAASFIPVVGPARYARQLERASGAMGRMAVRARVGAAEGAIGAAAVEPLVIWGASAREADYGIYDSVANLVFGTVLGGGLHAGGGALMDTVTGRKFTADLDALAPEERGKVMSAGVASVASGYKPIVMEPLVRAQLMSGAGRFRPYEGAPEIRGLPELADPSPQFVRLPMGDDGGKVRSFDSRRDAEAFAAEYRKTGNKALVRNRGDGRFEVEVDIDRDAFVRNDDGLLQIYPRKKQARTALRREIQEGRIEGGEVVKVKGDYVLTTETDPQKLAALRANADGIEIPVDMPARESRNGTTNFRGSEAVAPEITPTNIGGPVTAPLARAANDQDALADAIRRSRSESNRIFATQQAEALEQIEAERARHTENEDIGALRKELEDMVATVNEADPEAAEALAALDETLKQAQETGNGLRRAASCLIGVFT